MTFVARLTTAALAVAGLTVEGALRWRRALPEVPTETMSAGAAPSAVDHAAAASIDDAQQSIVDNDLFRLSNAPPTVRYDPRKEPTAIGSVFVPTPSLRPSMTLKAIVGGPPWSAVVDGIPGQPPGTIVRAGSTFDKLTAREVNRDSVVVQGPDTTWVLTFRRQP